MPTNSRLRLLSYGVIAYMLLAFAWWSVLLFIKNQDAFRAKRDLLKIGMVAEGIVENDAEFRQQEAYKELVQQYRAQEWMILGEASVFVISLVIGVWLINRSYNKEVMAARQQRNFLLSITHELKSPIASIKLVLETLGRRSLKPEQFQKMINNALNDTDRLNALVSDLLLSARLESAYQPYREEVDLQALVQDLIHQMENKYPQVEFVFLLDDPVPKIPGDKAGLTSVALNLLENAVKYSADAPQVEARLYRQEDQIIMEIADNGIGVDEREKKRIFEKFYRVGNEDTRKTKGTGLGLYIVDQIVRAHNGRIDVRDNHPRGTIFHIELPVQPVTAKEQTKAVQPET